MPVRAEVGRKTMVRNIIALIVGIVTAGVTIMAIQHVGNSMFPFPEDLDITDTAAFSAHIKSLPPLALFIVICSYAFAALDGTIIASVIGRANPKIFAAIIGGLILAATIFNVTQFWHPTWFVIAAVIAIIVSAFVGAIIGSFIQRQLIAGRAPD